MERREGEGEEEGEEEGGVREKEQRRAVHQLSLISAECVCALCVSA